MASSEQLDQEKIKAQLTEFDEILKETTKSEITKHRFNELYNQSYKMLKSGITSYPHREEYDVVKNFFSNQVKISFQLAAVTWAEELLNSRHKNIIKAAKKTKDADLVKDVVQDYMSLKYDLDKTPMQAKMETALKELKDAAHHVVEKNFDYDHRVEWLDFRKNFIEFYGDENVDVQKLSKLRTLANKIDESVLGPTHYATLGLHETLNKCIRKSIVTLWEPDLLAVSIPAVTLQRYIHLWGNFQANTTLIYLSLFLKLNLALVDETKIKEMGVVNSTETESLISWKNEMLDPVHETLVEASKRSKLTDVARIREVVEIYDRLKREFIYPFTNNALRDDVKLKGFKFVEAAKHVLEESEYTKSVFEFTL